MEEEGDEEVLHGLEDSTEGLPVARASTCLEEGEELQHGPGEVKEDCSRHQGGSRGNFRTGGLRASRRLRGLIPEVDLVGHILVGYNSEDE